jgi:hypothetical protein
MTKGDFEEVQRRALALFKFGQVHDLLLATVHHNVYLYIRVFSLF